MGYRSNARLRTTKEGYKVMNSEIDKFLLEHKNDEELNYSPSNLLKTGDITLSKNAITIDWEYIKWYEWEIEIKAFYKALSTLRDRNIDFQFIRIGEDYTDIEEISRINNNSFDDFRVARRFID